MDIYHVKIMNRYIFSLWFHFGWTVPLRPCEFLYVVIVAYR